MAHYDLTIIGAGISGLSLAHYAAKAGFSVLVLEKEARPGGCFYTHRPESGFWLELGAHTCYNSYRNLIALIEEAGIKDLILGRRNAPYKLLVGTDVKSIPSELDFIELLCSAPRIFTEKKTGRTVESYYSKLVGQGNYRKVIGPVLSAVPSQKADGFPAEMLFKKRKRRKDVIKNFTLKGGLQSVTDALASGLALRTGFKAGSAAFEGGMFSVRAGEETHTSGALALAVPPSKAASLLKSSFPDISSMLSLINVTSVESVGVVVKRDSVPLQPFSGLIPLNDLFFSVVSRDTVPDEDYRGFTFHFRAGIEHEAKLKRIREVLRVGEFEEVVSRRAVLPSPVLGHERLIAELEGRLSGKRLFLTGNYFSGLAIEDCVSRSLSEFLRFKGEI